MSGSAAWVHYFSDPLPGDASEWKATLGGKGASLKQMSHAGLRVPPGFTISTACCVEYFAQQHQWPSGLEEQLRDNLARLERETGRTLGRGARPLLVSVRSGAAASMPGMMDTLLNCGLHPALADDVGDTPHFWRLYLQFMQSFAKTVAGLDADKFVVPPSGGLHAGPPADRAIAAAYLKTYERLSGRPFPTDPWPVLVQCINAVFESWHSQRAVLYRQRHDIRGLQGTAVNVQMMFPSEVSGVLFTEDPNQPAARQMIVEASYGLGESVVSGEVTPDRFVIRRDDGSLVSQQIGHKAAVVSALGQEHVRDPDAASLTPPQLDELHRLALQVERHFGHAVDIEWGWAEGEFALLQARPIRHLDTTAEVENVRQQEIARLKQLAGDRRQVWAAHNLGETLRSPTPLTWDIVRQFMSGDGGFGRLYRQLGHRPSLRVCREGFLELICGRVYADPGRLAELFWDGMPLVYDLDALAVDPGVLDQAPSKFDPDRADAGFLVSLPTNLWGMWRASHRMRDARRQARERFETQALPPFLEYVECERNRDLSRLDDDRLLAELAARRVRVLDEFAPESLRPGFFGGLALDSLRRCLIELMGQDVGAAWADTLTRGQEGDTTREQDELLCRVAYGEATLDDFLARYGHRAVGEMELSQPRWREDASWPRQIVAMLAGGTNRTPEETHRDNVAQREAAEAELPNLLKRWGGSSWREQIVADMTDARQLLPYRESGKHYLMMGYDLLRRVLEELAARWDLGRGLYFLQLDELSLFARERPRLVDEISRRRARWQTLQHLEAPPTIDSQHLESLGQPAPLASTDGELHGTAMAAGVGTGTARIVFDPRDAVALRTDYILVCPSTDPGWTPLFMHARGLVVERGGLLSHGAIVARDFGIPAVACPQATRLLRPGDTIRVDGNRGVVSVVASAQQPEADDG